MTSFTSAKRSRLWQRFWSIEARRHGGLCEPILWHLALRRDHHAMTELADRLATGGKIANHLTRENLYYRAYRGGYGLAAQHLAMDAFNRRDLASYRIWLRRAAVTHFEYLDELKRFETRLPHRAAFDISRGRPQRFFD